MKASMTSPTSNPKWIHSSFSTFQDIRKRDTWALSFLSPQTLTPPLTSVIPSPTRWDDKESRWSLEVLSLLLQAVTKTTVMMMIITERQTDSVVVTIQMRMIKGIKSCSKCNISWWDRTIETICRNGQFKIYRINCNGNLEREVNQILIPENIHLMAEICSMQMKETTSAGRR